MNVCCVAQRDDTNKRLNQPGFLRRDPIFQVDQSFAYGVRERRSSPGPTPITRLKALLKAASD